MDKDKAIHMLERMQNPEPYDPQITSEAFDALQMAIDALSADGDTISRAKAIEALDKRFDSIPMEQTSEILMLRKDLRELPPAQLGTNFAEVGTDTISRQVAIEAVAEAMRGLPVVCIDIAEEAIKQLPPAQPERIKGRWVEKPHVHGVAYCSLCDYELHTNDTNFCPNCGADMREVTP